MEIRPRGGCISFLDVSMRLLLGQLRLARRVLYLPSYLLCLPFELVDLAWKS
jgi:hypothetical protein